MKLLFGSIIVKGAGRINGHVVRNFRGMPLLTRLALPTRTNIFNANPQINIATTAFKYWSSIDLEEQILWSDIAAQIPFTDRWGNTKYLSGRDFVSYVYINLINIGRGMYRVADFDNTFPDFFASRVTISATGTEFNVVDFRTNESEKQIIYLKKGINETRTYTEKQLKLIIATEIELNSSTTIYQELEEAGIIFQEGQTWTIGIKAISNSGLASPMQIFKAKVT
jgi:hypothetical protein